MRFSASPPPLPDPRPGDRGHDRRPRSRPGDSGRELRPRSRLDSRCAQKFSWQARNRQIDTAIHSCLRLAIKLPEGGLYSLLAIARLAQSAERKALNLVVVGSSPTVGGC